MSTVLGLNDPEKEDHCAVKVFIDAAWRKDGACFAGVVLIGGHTILSWFHNRAVLHSA